MSVRASNMMIMQSILNDTNNYALSSNFGGVKITADNYREFYENIMNLEIYRNEFVHALVTQIAVISIGNAMFENTLKELKSANMEYGNTEEEIFVNFVKDEDFVFTDDEHELYKFYLANIMSAFHVVNFKKKFPLTISYDELRECFRDEYGIQNLVNAKLDVIYASAEYKEFLQTRELFDYGVQYGVFYPVKVNKPTTEQYAKDLIQSMMTYADKLKFPNKLFNYAGSDATAGRDNLIIVTTPEYKNAIGVQALAYMFNVDVVDLPSKMLIVDEFKSSNTVAIVCDKRVIKIREQLREFTEVYNGNSLYWNYFLHLWEMFSLSPFYGAIVFTSADIGVKSITLPSKLTVTKGSKTNISVGVVGTNVSDYVPQMVDLEITSTPTSDSTFLVNGSTILYVGEDETLEEITIKATSRYDSSVTATATITLS